MLAAFRSERSLFGPTVIFVSRLEYANRVDLLLDASVILRRRLTELRVAIVGDGPERASLVQAIEARGLSDVVIMVGRLYDEMRLAPWFLCADVFCYPENVGLSLLHAFGYGVPAVVSDRRSCHNPEIDALQPGANGLLYQHGNAADLALQLTRILSDKPLRQALSASALSTVNEQYSLSRMVDGMEQAIWFAARSRKQRKLSPSVLPGS
ncbi:MAG: glycosyltransferase [Gemmatimonadaceae bacterium]